MNKNISRGGPALAAAASIAFLLALPAGAQIWDGRGPSPISPGPNVETLEPSTAAGAMHVLAPHPRRSQTLYAGSVNGGVWVTHNATSSKPRWFELTDDEDSLSISALEFDPTDRFHTTLVAGVGCYSSFGFFARQTGLLRTANGGLTWQEIDGGGVLNGSCISGVAPRGSTLVTSVAFSFPVSTLSTIGVFRSTDGGATMTQVSVGNGAATGLPSGRFFDLVGDPTDPDRLFTGSVFSDLQGGLNGIYRSDDAGATWTKVSTPAVDAFLVSGLTVNVELAVGRHDNVYAAIANFTPGFGGQLAAIFRSGDGGLTWQQLGLPGTVEDGGFFFGIHPGGQASIHMSIAADPTNPDLVYLGGDRQPGFTEASGNPALPFFPNSIGAVSFSGRLFRGDASQPPGSQWVPLTHSGTAGNSAPHADSRELAFDRRGDLIQSDDGGVYRRTDPESASGDWLSLNGSLQVTELHDIAFDSESDIIFGGSQDNATPVQERPRRPEYFFVVGGDGGDAAVDDFSTPGTSTRLASAQNLFGYQRTTWDGSNDLLTVEFPPLTVVSGPPIGRQFVTPFEINAVDPDRVIYGGTNAAYESFDQGDTVAALTPLVGVNGTGFDPIAYGAEGNPDVLYVGSGDSVFIRTVAGGSLVQSAAFPGTGTGAAVAEIVLDPGDPDAAFVATTTSVFRTEDAGATWSDITGDLLSQDIVLPLIAIERVPGQLPFSLDPDRLVVGASNGVFGASADDGYATWTRVGGNLPLLRLPTVAVFDLDYDDEDKVLIAGTMGRGAFRLRVLPFIGFVKEPGVE